MDAIFQPLTLLILTPVIALLGIGLIVGARNPRMREEAVGALPWLFIGVVLVFGAGYLATHIVAAGKATAGTLGQAPAGADAKAGQ